MLPSAKQATTHLLTAKGKFSHHAIHGIGWCASHQMNNGNIMMTAESTRVRNNTSPSWRRVTRCRSLSLLGTYSHNTLLRFARIPFLSLSYSHLAMSTVSGMDGFTDALYNNAADAFLQRVELIVDELNEPAIEEAQYSDGVLTIDTLSHGSFVLNKQAAKRQIWLSSPISGPFHYDMRRAISSAIGGDFKGNEEIVQWVCERDGHDLRQRLEDELGSVLHQTVKLS